MTALGVPLVFAEDGGVLCASLPGARYGYADSRGLWESRPSAVICHSGGDRQCSSGGRLWLLSPAMAEANAAGLHLAVAPWRLN